MFKIDIEKGLHLELLDLTHADRMYKVALKNRDEFIKWLPWVAETKSVEDTKEFIKGSLENFAKGKEINCNIFYKNELIGNIGLLGIKYKLKIKTADIGYWLDSDYQGRGIVTKAVNKMLEIAFLKRELARVTLHCATNNTNSCNVAKRVGFKFEGTLRGAAVVNGKVIDLNSFSILKDEFKGLK